MTLIGLYICKGCLRTWTDDECTLNRQREYHCPKCDDLCVLVEPKPELTGIERTLGVTA